MADIDDDKAFDITRSHSHSAYSSSFTPQPKAFSLPFIPQLSQTFFPLFFCVKFTLTQPIQRFQFHILKISNLVHQFKERVEKRVLEVMLFP